MPATHGVPLLNSRAAYDVVIHHASDLDISAPTVHNPLPTVAGSVPMADGTKYVLADVLTPAEHTAIGDNAPHHAAVTLGNYASRILTLTGQTLTTPVVNANKAYLGPASGADAAPDWRALVFADIPSSSNPGAAQAILATDGSGFTTVVKISSVTALHDHIGELTAGHHIVFDNPIVLPAGSASAGTAPIKLISGTLNTAAEIGAFEFLVDSFYGTITTGGARKEFMQWGKVPAVPSSIVFTQAPNEYALDTTPSVYPPGFSVHFTYVQAGAPVSNAYGFVETLRWETSYAFQWLYPLLSSGIAYPAYKPYFRLGDASANTWGAWYSLVAVDSTGTIVMPTNTSIGQQTGVLLNFDDVHSAARVFGGAVDVSSGGVLSSYGGLGASQNLLPYSESTSLWSYSAGWTLTGNTGDTTAPNETSTATKMVGTAGAAAIYWDGAALTAGNPYTVSIWMKGAAGGEIILFGISDGAATTVTLTAQWRRYYYSVAALPNTQLSRRIEIVTPDTPTIYVWGAQLVDGLLPRVYVRTGASLISSITTGLVVDGVQPLAGTKVYYVSDSNGGAVNRKLTFIAGILTAET